MPPSTTERCKELHRPSLMPKRDQSLAKEKDCAQFPNDGNDEWVRPGGGPGGYRARREGLEARRTCYLKYSVSCFVKPWGWAMCPQGKDWEPLFWLAPV